MRIKQHNLEALVGNTKESIGLDYLIDRNFKLTKQSITKPIHLVVFRRDPTNNRLDPYMTWIKGRPYETKLGRQWSDHRRRIIDDSGSAITEGVTE